jgi:hypothetical protein
MCWVGRILASIDSNGEVWRIFLQVQILHIEKFTRRHVSTQKRSRPCIGSAFFSTVPRIYFTKMLVKLLLKRLATLTVAPNEFLLGRAFAGAVVCRFSLKAAKRIHHGDSKRTGVGPAIGLDIALPANQRLSLLLRFALRLLLLIDLTPAVLALPLSFVTTPVFAGTVLLFAFSGILALVSTTPSR